MTLPCQICSAVDEDILYLSDLYRIISVNDPAWPGFCRVILNRHVSEMTEMPVKEQTDLMHAVFTVEAALRNLMRPNKINLASFGNVVPHVHWHIIPRWTDDSHFPDPIWGSTKRVWINKPVFDREALVSFLNTALTDSRTTTGNLHKNH